MPDIFQQVFHQVARNITDFRKDRPSDTFRGWLRVITRNKIRDHFRWSNRQPDAIGGTEANLRFAQLPDPLAETNDCIHETPNAELDADEEQIYGMVLRAAMDSIREQIQPQTWRAFWMVVLESKTPAEAAKQLDMRVGTVRVAKCRVLARLRQELGEVSVDALAEQQQLDRFIQAYAVERAKIEARTKGHTVTEQQLTDGSIKVTIQIGGAA